jgi:hypothetical protein
MVTIKPKMRTLLIAASFLTGSIIFYSVLYYRVSYLWPLLLLILICIIILTLVTIALLNKDQHLTIDSQGFRYRLGWTHRDYSWNDIESFCITNLAGGYIQRNYTVGYRLSKEAESRHFSIMNLISKRRLKCHDTIPRIYDIETELLLKILNRYHSKYCTRK